MMVMLMTVLPIMRIVALTFDRLLSNLANSRSIACALPIMYHINVITAVVIIILEKQGCAVVA